MARPIMVTRTITVTDVNVMCLNVTTGECENIDITLPRTYANAEKLLKAIKSVAETDELKCVHVVDKVEHSILYGMSEQTFIANAVELDPATRKAVDTAGVTLLDTVEE